MFLQIWSLAKRTPKEDVVFQYRQLFRAPNFPSNIIFWNTFPRQTLTSSLQNQVSDSTVGAFYAWKTTLFMEMYDRNETTKHRNTNISSFKLNSKNLFLSWCKYKYSVAKIFYNVILGLLKNMLICNNNKSHFKNKKSNMITNKLKNLVLPTRKICVSLLLFSYTHTCSNYNVTYIGKTCNHFLLEQLNIWVFEI